MKQPTTADRFGHIQLHGLPGLVNQPRGLESFVWRTTATLNSPRDWWDYETAVANSSWQLCKVWYGKICSSQGLSLKPPRHKPDSPVSANSDCQPDGKVCKDCTSETNDTNLAASKWFQLCAGYGSWTLNIKQKPPVEMLVSTCWGQEAKNQGGMSIGGQCGTLMCKLLFTSWPNIYSGTGGKNIFRKFRDIQRFSSIRTFVSNDPLG